MAKRGGGAARGTAPAVPKFDAMPQTPTGGMLSAQRPHATQQDSRRSPRRPLSSFLYKCPGLATWDETLMPSGRDTLRGCRAADTSRQKASRRSPERASDTERRRVGPSTIPLFLLPRSHPSSRAPGRAADGAARPPTRTLPRLCVGSRNALRKARAGQFTVKRAPPMPAPHALVSSPCQKKPLWCPSRAAAGARTALHCALARLGRASSKCPKPGGARRQAETESPAPRLPLRQARNMLHSSSSKAWRARGTPNTRTRTHKQTWRRARRPAGALALAAWRRARGRPGGRVSRHCGQNAAAKRPRTGTQAGGWP